MAQIRRIRLLCGLSVHHSPMSHSELVFVNLRPRRTILATLTRNYAVCYIHCHCWRNVSVTYLFALRSTETGVFRQSKSTARSTPNKPKTQKRVPGYAIRTLDPTRLQASDFHDISHIRQPMYSTDREDVRGTVYRTLQKISYFIKEPDPNGVPFPPGTQGFLYYSWPLAPNSAPSSTVSSADGNSQGIIKQQKHIEKLGQIRFRKTESSDPATFAKGTDLMLPSGVPWIMYPRPDPNTRETFFWKLILRDGMASTDVGITYPTFLRPISGPEVTTFGQPFSVRFNKTTIRCLLLSHKEQTRRCFVIHNPLRPRVENSSRTGSAEYSG